MRGFTSYHPVVLFLYYVLAVCFSMFSMHPVIILSSIFGAFLFFGALNGRKKLISELIFFCLLFVLVAMTNPLFVHNGETILFFMNDNPITLEAMIYGVSASGMIVGVMVWCRCYSQILTTDKFLYLFGKLIPKLGLVLTMAFRFLPLFKRQIQKIHQTQKTMGLYATDSIPDRIGGGIRVFDSLIGWSMENSLDTADAMKARGYGLKGRSNFSLFQFSKRDGILLGSLIGNAVILLVGFLSGTYEFFYYPYLAEIKMDVLSVIQYLAILFFFCVPGIVEWKEKITWKYLKLKI